MRERHWDPKQTRAGRTGDKPVGARPPKDKSRFAAKPKPVRAPIPDGVAILYGWHPVAAALRNPQRTIRKILATENGAHRLTEDGIALPVSPEIVRPEAIAARLSPDAGHQGVLVEADTLPAVAARALAVPR